MTNKWENTGSGHSAGAGVGEIEDIRPTKTLVF